MWLLLPPSPPPAPAKGNGPSGGGAGGPCGGSSWSAKVAPRSGVSAYFTKNLVDFEGPARIASRFGKPKQAGFGVVEWNRVAAGSGSRGHGWGLVGVLPAPPNPPPAPQRKSPVEPADPLHRHD